MKRDGMTMLEQMLEAVGIVSAVLCAGLQIYYGVVYAAPVLNLVMNVAVLILVYAGLTLLALYPERVNGLSAEVCTGRIRKYTVQMVRLIKLVFVLSVLFTSVCDVMGIEMNKGYSLIVVILIVAVTAFYEYRIIKILRNNRGK